MNETVNLTFSENPTKYASRFAVDSFGVKFAAKFSMEPPESSAKSKPAR